MLKDLGSVVDKAERSGKTEEDFIAATELMMAKQFIWMDGHGQNKHYQLVVLYREYFENLMDALGRDLIIEQKFGYCGWVPRNSAPTLPKLETIFLLTLAKLHDVECLRACTENGRSMPTPAALIQAYCELTGREKPVRKRTLEALSRLEKQSVIRLGPKEDASELPTITVLPTILAVVNRTFLEELECFAEDVIDESDASESEDDETLVDEEQMEDISQEQEA
jgi:Domain of unknown function (DUF4194)